MAKRDRAFKEVSSRVDSDSLEQTILSYWERNRIFNKSLEKRVGQEQYTFFDGPPYATGKPHYGHILQSAIKDTVLRFKTMRGYYVPRRVGWDTHGLPIEVIVEKELGFKTKKDIEEYGIAEFNAKCREMVTQYVDEFTATLKRLGRWADYENAYYTLDRDYMESEWWVFKQLWDKNLVVKDFRSTPYCVRCETPLSNYEVSSNYQDKNDTAVFVKLRVKENLNLLIWTTTPWTLPANVAVAIAADLEYVSIKQGEEEFIVAKDLAIKIFGEGVEIVKDWQLDELLKMTYDPIYSFLPADNAYRVVVSDHVTGEEGTGLVHLAPAFGPEDAEVARREKLPVLKTVDMAGKFISEMGEWSGLSLFEANEKVISDLEVREQLFKKEHYRHSYPFCWRCDEPLIYYALDSWFIKVTDIKDDLLKTNQEITWIPEHVKEGRFGKGLAGAPDWAVSRNRYWSVPIPIWECSKCEDRVCVSSVDELKELSGETSIVDLHRPYVDEIKWACECGGEKVRILEVLDVWFDSGAMPYAQWHYPFENQESIDQYFPADFIVEAIEMTRAWFYFLHVLAGAVFKKPAFLAAIASGLIFAEDGRKLSKKLKNYPEPEPVFEKYGADVLRFYLLTSSSLGEPYRFSEKDMGAVRRNVYETLWNVYSLLVRYANAHGWQAGPVGESLIDKWILARTHQLESEVIELADRLQIDTAGRKFADFVDDLSNWYVRRSRTRFQQGDDQAFGTLYEVLVRLAKVLAPFMPFIAEELYRNLAENDSVHLEDLESPAAMSRDEERILGEMKELRQQISDALGLRAKAGIKVRQPLPSLSLVGEFDEEFLKMAAEEVNVKEIKLGKNLELDTKISEELKYEGWAREIIRNGQALRRRAGYDLKDTIVMSWELDDSSTKQGLSGFKPMIMKALQATDILDSTEDADELGEVKLDNRVIKIGVKR